MGLQVRKPARTLWNTSFRKLESPKVGAVAHLVFGVFNKSKVLIDRFNQILQVPDIWSQPE